MKGSIPTTLPGLTALTGLGFSGNPKLGGSLLPELNWKQYTQYCDLTHISFACPLPAGSDQCNTGADAQAAEALLLLHKVKSTGATSRSKSCHFKRSAAPAAYGVRSNAR